MRHFFQTALFVLIGGLLLTPALANGKISDDRIWRQIDDTALRSRGLERQIVPDSYETFSLNRAALQSVLNSAPLEFTGRSQPVLTLPMPDGSFQRFRIEESPVMEPALAAQFPEIRTYRAQGIDDPTASCRFDLLPSGFHAMIISATGTSYVDPYAKGDTANYVVHWKGTLPRTGDPTFCGLNNEIRGLAGSGDGILPEQHAATAPEVTNGTQLRTYRLAVAASGEYTAAAGGGTVSGALAAQVLIMNRVNGIYERDLAIRMTIVANNNLIVYTNAITDPYTNEDPEALLEENQANLDAVIGSANYDIGHVFTTGGGGLAGLGVVCETGAKAVGETGLGNPVGDDFAVDFVAHEVGHQFGSDHSFNTSCGGNRNASTAYEPGSGVTIMGYAGVCGTQDLAPHSIDSFHVKSIEEIIAYSQSASGACSVTTASGNTPPAVSVVGGPSWNIPKQTPFALTASGTDANGDSLTYDWQEYDLGTATSGIPNSDASGARPIFRPYSPTVSGTRTFPSLTYILNNANVPPSTYGGGFLTGELLPAITRTMTFQVIARDNRANGGGINTATATVAVNAAAGPFVVTAPNTAVNWTGNSTQTVTWDVANTTAAPVSAANVKISFSADGGQTFPTVLNAATANDGSETITVPNVNTSQARIKVEAVGNIFFDISSANFTTTATVVPTIRSRADFDGDGKTDVSIYRPSNGVWYLQQSTAGFGGNAFGNSGDTPIPGDYDNDGKTDIAVYRPGAPATFYVLNSSNSAVVINQFGTTGDVPISGDFDGDGASDLTVYRSSNSAWFTLKSTGGTTGAIFGAPGDTPAAGNYDGDTKTDLAVFRNGNTWIVQPSSNPSNPTFTTWGLAGDLAVPADYDGDNKDDVAVFRPSNGAWYIANSGGGVSIVTWGVSGDVPVPGDYDGDNKDDVAIFRPSSGTWYMNRSTSGISILAFGSAGDKPVPKGYLP